MGIVLLYCFLQGIFVQNKRKHRFGCLFGCVWILLACFFVALNVGLSFLQQFQNIKGSTKSLCWHSFGVKGFVKGTFQIGYGVSWNMSFGIAISRELSSSTFFTHFNSFWASNKSPWVNKKVLKKPIIA